MSEKVTIVEKVKTPKQQRNNNKRRNGTAKERIILNNGSTQARIIQREVATLQRVANSQMSNRLSPVLNVSGSGRVMGDVSVQPNAFMSPMVKKKSDKSDYTTAITLPSEAPLKGIPDPIAEMTGVFGVPISVNLSVIGAGQTNPVDYSYGGNNRFNSTLLTKITRSFFNPVQVFQEFNIVAPTNTNSVPYSTTALVKLQSVNSGVFDLLGRPIVGDGQPMFLPGSGLPVNLVSTLNYESGTSMDYAIHPNINSNPQGNFYGHSINFRNSDGTAASNGQIIVNMSFDVPSGSITGGLTVNLVDVTGVIATTTVNLSGNTTATFASGTMPNMGFFSGDRMVGITIQANAAAGADIVMDSFNVSYQWFAGHTYPQLNWKPYNFDDVAAASKAYSKFRVVGMQHWLKYVGGYGINDNGGTISATSYSGGNAITMAGSTNGSFLWTDQGIRSLERSYTGNMENGSYGFSYPSDFSSLNFQTFGSLEPYKDTQGIICVRLNANNGGVTPLNAFMLKWFAIYEATPQRSWIVSRPSETNSRDLEKTKRNIEKILRVHGAYMANDTHEDILKYAQLPADVLASSFTKLAPIVQQIMPFLIGASFL